MAISDLFVLCSPVAAFVKSLEFLSEKSYLFIWSTLFKFGVGDCTCTHGVNSPKDSYIIKFLSGGWEFLGTD